MLHSRLPLVLAAAVLLVGCKPPPTGGETRSPRERTALPLSAVPRPLSSGQRSFAQTIDGKVTVIDLWATWCGPCRESIPKVVRLHDAYEPAGLVVVGVHVGQGVGGALQFAEQANIRYPLFADEDYAFSDSVESRSVPTLLVLDKRGAVAYRGRELDADVLALIRDLLAES